MFGMQGPLGYLVVSAGISMLLLFALLIYGNTLSLREDDQFHVNKAQEEMADQGVLLGRMKRLRRVVVSLAVLSGVLLLASAGVWVWIGLKSS